jgi:alkylated DNA repair dioxygenase AlkB
MVAEMNERDFRWHKLGGTHGIWIGSLPPEVALSSTEFAQCWALHPADYHLINIHGRQVPTPRWQQAYGRDYAYTGQINKALPLPPLLARLLEWGQAKINPRLNGVLVNWYDGMLGHYIGRHRDSTRGMVPGTPIVTISAGEQRTFRLRPWRGVGHQDFPVTDGSVVVMPYDTNLMWTHEVPASARRTGRRISVTLREFGS